MMVARPLAAGVLLPAAAAAVGPKPSSLLKALFSYPLSVPPQFSTPHLLNQHCRCSRRANDSSWKCNNPKLKKLHKRKPVPKLCHYCRLKVGKEYHFSGDTLYRHRWLVHLFDNLQELKHRFYIKKKKLEEPFTGYRAGTVVEISKGCAWFQAIVLDRVNKTTFHVEYAHAKSLAPHVERSEMRPNPPYIHRVQAYQVGEIVEAFTDSGWWVGTIVETIKSPRKFKYMVGMEQHYMGVMEFEHVDIRPHQQWKEGPARWWFKGKWIVSGQESPKDDEEMHGESFDSDEESSLHLLNFHVLSIPTKINKGTVEITNTVDIIQKGEKIGSSEAALLSKLGIKPFSYGLLVQSVLDDGSVFSHEVLDNDLLEKFANGVSIVAFLSLAISFPTLVVEPQMFVNDYKNVLAIAVASQYTFLKADNVKEFLKGNVGLAFTKGDLQEVREEISNFKLLSIPTKTNKGTVEITNTVDIIKKGEKVGSSEAALLLKLGIKPFSYGLLVQSVLDDGSVCSPEVLDNGLLEKFANGVSMVASLSLAISFPTLAVAPQMFMNGCVLAIVVASNYTFIKADKVKKFLKDLKLMAAAAAAPVAVSATATTAAPAAAKKEKKEEPAKESDDDLVSCIRSL